MSLSWDPILLENSPALPYAIEKDARVLEKADTLTTVRESPFGLIAVGYGADLVTGITAASIQSLNQHFQQYFTGFGGHRTVLCFDLLHEYAHAVVARMEGLRVLEIGRIHLALARFEHPPEPPGRVSSGHRRACG